ncbi:uncharacterized protein BDZ99DRAFT_471818 [Mytilinidion resinicola]|uniref:Uncharacterized protein n=1 Tax=Mytilinidion resinicola TaxID=574789 RepID=A0A6A6Z7A8_9PEZI|nr:uncharacterized protein BDZ99DRAFT_471818 [Mytilinidion resinicola]KAF2816599.1 hypothetical protein BDZ99DRAFT_471818 [Mytilinidion resinicola]
MAGKSEYVDVTKQTEDDYVDVTAAPPAYGEPNGGEGSNSDSRVYTDTLKADAKGKVDVQSPKESSNQSSSRAEVSIAEEVASEIRSLDVGDPNESISIPMILSTEKRSFKSFIKGKSGEVSQQVIVRKMTREHYKKFYAKDKDGNYVGTEKAAPDAGLVFVPSKSTPEDILEQVRKVAFGKQHNIDGFGGVYAYGVGGGGYSAG